MNAQQAREKTEKGKLMMMENQKSDIMNCIDGLAGCGVSYFERVRVYPQIIDFLIAQGFIVVRNPIRYDNFYDITISW